MVFLFLKRQQQTKFLKLSYLITRFYKVTKLLHEVVKLARSLMWTLLDHEIPFQWWRWWWWWWWCYRYKMPENTVPKEAAYQISTRLKHYTHCYHFPFSIIYDSIKGHQRLRKQIPFIIYYTYIINEQSRTQKKYASPID